MGRAIDLFVTYRFIKLLVTPFEKTDAYKLGIIDENGNRVIPPPVKGVRQTNPEPLRTTAEKNAYTIFRGWHNTITFCIDNTKFKCLCLVEGSHQQFYKPIRDK